MGPVHRNMQSDNRLSFEDGVVYLSKNQRRTHRQRQKAIERSQQKTISIISAIDTLISSLPTAASVGAPQGNQAAPGASLSSKPAAADSQVSIVVSKPAALQVPNKDATPTSSVVTNSDAKPAAQGAQQQPSGSEAAAGTTINLLASTKPTIPRPVAVAARQRHEEGPVDLLVQRIDHYLLAWSNKPPDSVFCRGLLEIMLPPDDLLYSMYLNVRDDFRRALAEKFDHFEMHPFGSAVSGLAFRGEYLCIYYLRVLP